MMRRLYRLALRLLPRRFREAYGREMETALDDALRDERGLARLVAFLRALADIPRANRLIRSQKRGAPPVPVRCGRTVIMESFLHDVTLGGRALIKRPGFAAVALAACWVPAKRATRVDAGLVLKSS